MTRSIPPTSLLLALLASGCGGDPVTPDAAGLDANVVPDAFVEPGLDAPLPPDAGTDVTITDDAGPTACLGPSTRVEGSETLDHALGRATLTIEGDRDACRRTYALASTGAWRDMMFGLLRTFSERETDLTLRTGHDLFDALFALAMDEAHENSVGSI